MINVKGKDGMGNRGFVKVGLNACVLAAVMLVCLFVCSGCNTAKTAPMATGRGGWPAGAEEGFIPVDGGKVLYHLYGKGKKGIPIIFLHGGPGVSATCFFKQSVLGAEHPVVFFNQLGSDGSDYTEGTTLEQAQGLMTIEHYVDEVQSVVDYFNFDEFILVGKSWGTMLAVEYAASKHPRQLKGIVLGGPFLNVDIWCSDAERLIKSLPEQEVCRKMMDGSGMWSVIQECEKAGTYYDDARYAAINEIYSDNFYSRAENAGLLGVEPSDEQMTQYKIEGLSVYDYMWGPSEFSCMGTLEGHDSTALLKKIEVPILYVCGEYDSGTFEAARIYKSMSNEAEITVIGGCGHNFPRERGTEFNAIIEGFAERISSSSKN